VNYAFKDFITNTDKNKAMHRKWHLFADAVVHTYTTPACTSGMRIR